MENPFSTLRTHLYLVLSSDVFIVFPVVQPLKLPRDMKIVNLSIAWLQEYFGIRLVLNILHLCKSYEFFMTKVLMIETYVFLIPIKYFWHLHVTMYFWLAKKMMYWDLHLYLRSTYTTYIPRYLRVPCTYLHSSS